MARFRSVVLRDDRHSCKGHLWVGHRRSKPRSVQRPRRATTRITVRYGRTHGTGKLGPQGAFFVDPAAAGTSPSRLALSAEVPGDFPQSGRVERGRAAGPPARALRVFAPKRVSAVPHLVSVRFARLGGDDVEGLLMDSAIGPAAQRVHDVVAARCHDMYVRHVISDGMGHASETDVCVPVWKSYSCLFSRQPRPKERTNAAHPQERAFSSHQHTLTCLAPSAMSIVRRQSSACPSDGLGLTRFLPRVACCLAACSRCLL